MLEFIVGVVVASVVWFFVWRNNKNKFMATLTSVDTVINESKLAEEVKASVSAILAKFKK